MSNNSIPPIPFQMSIEGETKGPRPPFPLQLYKLLELVEEHPGAKDIISWLPCGKAFRVHKRDQFEATLMTKFFKQTVFRSFLRQINMWGFTRVNHGESKGAYKHYLFQRGQPDLCHQMMRGRLPDVSLDKSGGNNNLNTSSGPSGQINQLACPDGQEINLASERAMLHQQPDISEIIHYHNVEKVMPRRGRRQSQLALKGDRFLSDGLRGKLKDDSKVEEWKVSRNNGVRNLVTLPYPGHPIEKMAIPSPRPIERMILDSMSPLNLVYQDQDFSALARHFLLFDTT